jgi:hypothetical protein
MTFKEYDVTLTNGIEYRVVAYNRSSAMRQARQAEAGSRGRYGKESYLPLNAVKKVRVVARPKSTKTRSRR